MKKTKFFEVSINYGFYGIDEPEVCNLQLVADSYQSNGSLAVFALEENGEEFDTITVNLPFGDADESHAYIDTNNCPWAEAMLKQHNIAKPTGEHGHSGYCTYPLYEFDLSKFQ